MVETEITFINRAGLRVQLQIYDGRTLAGTCVTGPGEIGVLPAALERYDIYLKNSATGWEIGHKLNSADKTLTLTQENGRFIIT